MILNNRYYEIQKLCANINFTFQFERLRKTNKNNRTSVFFLKKG